MTLKLFHIIPSGTFYHSETKIDTFFVAAVVFKHLLWCWETCIQITTVSVTANSVTLVKSSHFCVYE